MSRKPSKTIEEQKFELKMQIVEAKEAYETALYFLERCCLRERVPFPARLAGGGAEAGRNHDRDLPPCP